MKRKGREMRAAGWRRSIARCSGRCAERSERAGVDAAVDQEILAGDVARLHAAQICAELAELFGRAEAARRNRLLDIPPHLLCGLALLFRAELGVALQPVGPEAPGEQVVDRDVVRDGRAREARHEAGEAAPRAFESASSAIGAFTALEVMLRMRPKRLAIIPSTVALISSIGVIMFAPTAFSQ